jgi:ADP-ribose pyrophosphatase
LAYETVESKTVYEGIIMDIKIDRITLPDGRTALREIAVRGGAAAVLPVDADNNIVFVRQYRHTARKPVLEIPAGMLDDGEDPLDCAVRELEEETGYKSDDVTHMFSMYPSIGLVSEILYIYKAVNLYEGTQKFDPDEFIEVVKYPLKQAVEMIRNGEIIDGKTIAAVLALASENCLY